MPEPSLGVSPACQPHARCGDGSCELAACRMGSRYTQAQQYELEWDDDAPPDSEGSSIWQEKSPHRRRNLLLVASLGLLVLVGLLLYMFRYKLFYGLGGVPVGLWSRNGVLTVGSDTPFHVKGISWYGLDLTSGCLEGLDKTSMHNILDIVAEQNFNALRIPIALDSYTNNNAIDTAHLSTFANPELANARFLDVLDRVILEAAARDILVLLDLHRLAAAVWPTDGMWYSDTTSENDVLRFWSSVAQRYQDRKIYWNIIGADVFNEPHGASSWDDWKSFVERASLVISKYAPSWLIMAEGVGNEAGQVEKPVFWGENLHPAYSDPPVVRPDPRKLVLSPHVYGPSVHNQSYFDTSDFPSNMPGIWDDHFGLAADRTKAAVIIGEFGGRNVDKDAAWQSEFVKYLNGKGFSSFYWCLNPLSSDTGGLLTTDWRTLDETKAALLSKAKSTAVAPVRWHFQRK